MQCWMCIHYLFFKPLPDETYVCCFAWGETVADIDLRRGESPKIKEYLSGEKKCPKFEEGESICEASPGKPFDIHPLRQSGEILLFERLSEIKC